MAVITAIGKKDGCNINGAIWPMKARDMLRISFFLSKFAENKISYDARRKDENRGAHC